MLADRPHSYQAIWQVVCSIPPGRVASYGQVATAAGFANAPRLTGRALRALPDDTRIPWHRVINAAGKLSLPPGSAAYQKQRQRLLAEGIVFQADRIRLADYRWLP